MGQGVSIIYGYERGGSCTMVGWGIGYGYEKGRVPVMGMRSRGGVICLWLLWRAFI